MSFHNFILRSIDGHNASLADWRGNLVLVVNVASQCGLTPQYAGLQALHARYRDRGFAVLGFPCNQFGSQEPGTDAQIAQFCESRFRVDFPMFAKISVNGPDAHPLYAWLRQETGGADIGWNFAKFLVDGEGKILKRYAPTDTPEAIDADIARALG